MSCGADGRTVGWTVGRTVTRLPNFLSYGASLDGDQTTCKCGILCSSRGVHISLNPEHRLFFFSFLLFELSFAEGNYVSHTYLKRPVIRRGMITNVYIDIAAHKDVNSLERAICDFFWTGGGRGFLFHWPPYWRGYTYH